MQKTFSVLSHSVIRCAIEVHKELGPGLLESIYRKCLAREFELAGIPFACEVHVPVTYKGLHFEWAYRADFLVESCLLLELKCVDKVMPIHRSQALTYMRLLRASEGLLLNFWVPRLKDDGIVRLVL